jgi:hypothetical protein
MSDILITGVTGNVGRLITTGNVANEFTLLGGCEILKNNIRQLQGNNGLS